MQSSQSLRCVRVEESAGLLSVILSRPPWNILNIEMLGELEQVFEDASLAGARAVMLYGEGRGFCAGAAVEDHLPEKVEAMLASFTRLLEAVHRASVPVIAAVHGVALGGGLELASAADILFAAADAQLGQPEVRLGAIAPGALFFLPRRLGYNRAADVLFSGRNLAAPEAKELGLVNFVYPGEKLLEEARNYATRLASLSGPVLRAYKQALLQASESPGSNLRQLERFYIDRIAPMPDNLEGLRSFIEKRPPVWAQSKEGELS
ncbi:MAG: enoyl-CoA hydratase/isomerase family protein [Acidobacteria bacterium]|nr:enoyl-CoA hydratase/isomerase family protein [Acidobacteriota bacterium]